MKAAQGKQDTYSPSSMDPAVLQAIQGEFLQEWGGLMDAARQGALPALKDRRFAAEAWQHSQPHLLLAHLYLLSTRTLKRMADAANLGESTRQRLHFALMQWTDALAPSNFLALNPDALQSMIDSKGASLQAGLSNFLQDVGRRRISQTDESQFEVGGNVATTPGQIVYENRFFQLIQYAPQTDKVYERPLLFVPPCINKYYILDLQQHNSLVRHAVEQGHRLFLVSWRNPLPEDQDLLSATWDDYIEQGVLEAIRVVSDITAQPRINILGFCVGGTLLASALALAKTRGQDLAESITLLTTMLDFSDTGILDVFVDETHTRLREQTIGQGGLLSAQELATTFSFLRPNELVWNYVVGNYLKGESPKAFDLLYWNSDSTNLPGPFFTWYFRNTYLENNLCQPGRLSVGGQPQDLRLLDMPAYVFGSREDHIVPWKTAYLNTGILQGPIRFVLGASGHIAGVINPAASNKRSYWAEEGMAEPGGLPQQADDWFAGATEHPGSWWPDWMNWLSGYAGKQVAAKKRLGSSAYPPIEPAPGRYVKVRAV